MDGKYDSRDAAIFMACDESAPLTVRLRHVVTTLSGVDECLRRRVSSLVSDTRRTG